MTASLPADELAPLVVLAREQLATDIYGLVLGPAAGGSLQPFTPGAHITVRTPMGEVRKYSLTNAPEDGDRYEIAVKRDAAGRGGSVSMADAVRVGDTLLATRPRNDFALAERAREFLFIAGGIGITPLMSMMRHLQATGHARFKLVYLTERPESTAFRDELLGPAFHGRVKLHHDEGQADRMFDLWPLLERPTQAHVYCCGPRGLMEAVRDMTGHWPASAVHFESFLDGATTHQATDRAFRVRLARSGDVVDVPADTSILEALRARGHDVPSSCESGTCGTCRTRLLAGTADHRDFVLMQDEQADQIMVCVSRALSDELVLDL